jgi:hypothetical protein
MFAVLIAAGFLLIPSLAFAWGPLTHMYLGNELFSLAPMIPAGIYGLIKKYRQDFLYGNLMADAIIGKKYLPDEKSSHSWDVALRILRQAETDPEKSFAYGYMSHLAADTVAHGILTEDMKNLEHTLAEMKADGMINKIYWLQSVTFSKAVQRRNDLFLENSLDPYRFSFKTNRRIYKSIVFFSFFNKKPGKVMDRAFISNLHDESLSRMIDLLQNGTEAFVLDHRPL